MTHGYTNEAGEPIMSGEAYRYEQYLDAANPPYCGLCGGAHDELNCASDEDYEDDEDLDDEDETEKTMEIPVVGYQCGVCDEAFPPGVTGHTNDNPCAG